SLNYGQASILTPSDFSFSRDGILAEGIPNQESMVIGELDLALLAEQRASGTVLPLLDSEKTSALLTEVDLVSVIPSEDRYEVRQTQPADFPDIIALCHKIYPDSISWSPVQLESHRTLFPEGQMVVLERETGKLIGCAASRIIDRHDDD